jgi:hypothetical protein
MVRRILFIGIAFNFDGRGTYELYFQSVFLINLTALYMNYLAHTNPTGDRFDNRVAIANEFFYLSQGYVMLMFSGVVTDIKILDVIGKLMVMVLYAQILFNILVSIKKFFESKKK